MHRVVVRLTDERSLVGLAANTPDAVSKQCASGVWFLLYEERPARSPWPIYVNPAHVEAITYSRDNRRDDDLRRAHELYAIEQAQALVEHVLGDDCDDVDGAATATARRIVRWGDDVP